MYIYELKVRKDDGGKEKWTEIYYQIAYTNKILMFILNAKGNLEKLSDPLSRDFNLSEGGRVSFRELKGWEVEELIKKYGMLV